MRQLLRNVLTTAAFCVSAGACAAPSALEYSIGVEPRSDRTDLAITLRWRETAAVEIELPRDYYGSPDLAQFVTGIEGLEGSTVSPGADMRHRWVTPNSKGSAVVRYRMEYRPEILGDASFGPLTTPSQVQVFGCQWMLRIGDLEEARPVRIRWSKLPKGWITYSTLAPKADEIRVTQSYSDLLSSVLGAGNVARHRFAVRGKPVDVYLARGFHLGTEEVFRKLEAVVKMQRKWFDDYAQPFYVVAISVRPDNIAGTAVQNGFVCFIKPDVAAPQLLDLLSHEMLHYWIPGRMHVDDPGETERWKWEWFDEGFDEFFARQILLDSGAITRAEFADLLNRDLVNIADNPLRGFSYEQVVADIKGGKFSVAHKKLSYYRGSVMAANWNARILAKSGGKRSAGDVIRGLYRLAVPGKGHLSQSAFFAAFEKEGVDARGDWQRHIIEGRPLEPEPAALGAGYRLDHPMLPLYDPGFDVTASLRAKKVTGVVPGGAAERAGLREGMVLRSVRNSLRFGNAWNPDRPLSVWVEVDGKERQVDVVPRGAARPVPQYVPRS